MCALERDEYVDSGKMKNMETRSNAWRTVGRWAVAAGAAWTAQSALSLALPDPTDLLDDTMIVPMTLTMIALWQLRAAGAFGNGQLSNAIAALAAIGVATIVPCQVGFATGR